MLGGPWADNDRWRSGFVEFRFSAPTINGVVAVEVALDDPAFQVGNIVRCWIEGRSRGFRNEYVTVDLALDAVWRSHETAHSRFLVSVVRGG